MSKRITLELDDADIETLVSALRSYETTLFGLGDSLRRHIDALMTELLRTLLADGNDYA